MVKGSEMFLDSDLVENIIVLTIKNGQGGVTRSIGDCGFPGPGESPGPGPQKNEVIDMNGDVVHCVSREIR